MCHRDQQIHENTPFVGLCDTCWSLFVCWKLADIYYRDPHTKRDLHMSQRPTHIRKHTYKCKRDLHMWKRHAYVPVWERRKYTLEECILRTASTPAKRNLHMYDNTPTYIKRCWYVKETYKYTGLVMAPWVTLEAWSSTASTSASSTSTPTFKSFNTFTCQSFFPTRRKNSAFVHIWIYTHILYTNGPQKSNFKKKM